MHAASIVNIIQKINIEDYNCFIFLISNIIFFLFVLKIIIIKCSLYVYRSSFQVNHLINRNYVFSMKSNFWNAGHKPTLFAAFLYFDLSFMVWVLLGPLAVQIAADLQLSPVQKGMMVATPILSGALLRLVMGVLVDYQHN